MKDLHLNVNDAAFEIINNKKLLNKYSYSKLFVKKGGKIERFSHL